MPYALVGVAAIALMLVFYFSFRNAGVASYVTAPVSRGAITRSVTASGSVNPVLTIIVGSYVSGVIQQINCDFNTKVTKGQICARIDPRPYQSVVDQDRASLANAKAQRVKDEANLAYAEITERRYRQLQSENAIAQDTYDIAMNALRQARAQVTLDAATIEQRQASLNASLVNLSYTDIVAPVDGIVVSRNVTIGQTVAASFQTPTLFLIATSLSKMQVDTNVSESDIGAVRIGDKASFTVEADPRSFEGIVTQVRQAPQTVQNVVTYDVVITVNNNDAILKPGMTATVKIVTAERDKVMRVPNQALRYVPGGVQAGRSAAADKAKGVWVLRNGTPEHEAVTTGLDNDTFTEIRSGHIDVGDSIIVGERSGATTGQKPAAPSIRLP